MNVTITIGDRHLFLLVTFSAVILLGGIAVAYNSGGPPTVMGHSPEELNLAPLYINTLQGKVGIGTPSPFEKLDVVGNVNITGNLRFSNTGNVIGGGASNDLFFQTQNTERMRITAGGSVGIGTSSPVQRLDVDGAIAVRGARVLPATGNGLFLDFGGAAGPNLAAIYGYDYGSSIPRDVVINPLGGRVGIGTPSTSSRLEVLGDVKLSGANPYLQLDRSSGTDWNLSYDGTDDLSLYSVIGGIPTQRAEFQSDGDVYVPRRLGIGTASPSEKLEVSGNIRAGNITANNLTASTHLCIGGDCRTGWPSGGGIGVRVVDMGDESQHISYATTCTLMSDKKVKCWGYNGYYELGIGVNTNRYLPEIITLPGNVKSIAWSMHDSYAVLENGEVWAWGYNGNGELGSGDITAFSIPVRTGALTDVIKVVTSQGPEELLNSACALKSDGTVWCWGYGFYGQMGDGADSNNLLPGQVITSTGAALTGIVDIEMSGGQSASVCGWTSLASGGNVWCWGHNNFGQLGDGTSTNHKNAAVQVQGGLSSVIMVRSTGSNTYTHRCALKSSDGTVWCWGYNGYGQLGIGTSDGSVHSIPSSANGLTGVKSIAVGGGQYGSTFAILGPPNDGAVRAWGYNGYGQLGVSGSPKTSPINPGLSNVKQVAISGTGSYTTACALLNDGTARCMGYNTYGQIGDGTSVDKSVPTYVFRLLDAEKIWARGYSNGGYFCALLTSGRMLCWGFSQNGQLGTGDTTNLYVPQYVKDLNS